jgi:hypothetical protein
LTGGPTCPRTLTTGSAPAGHQTPSS